MSPNPISGTTVADYAAMVRRWWRTAAVIVGAALAITLILTLVAKPIYTARASLLPESAGPEASGLASLLMNNVGLVPGLTTGPATPGDIAMSLLQSKSLAGAVVDTLDLVHAWNLDDGNAAVAHEIAIDKLQKAIRITQDEHTLVKLWVEDTDPARAAAIANAYLDALDRSNQQFTTGSAARTRRFVEGRLKATEGELARAQADLEAFQRKHGALAMDEQTKATIEAVAKLQGEIEALKARRDALKFSMSERSSEVGTLAAQIEALQGRVKSLVSSDGTGAGTGGVLLSLGDVPALAAQYARLYLAVKTQSTVYGMLAQQLEQAKIEEARNTPTVRILDRATPPLYKTRPKRKLNMAVGLVLGCAVAFLVILVLDRMAPREGSEGARWKELVRRPPFSRAA